MKEELIDRFKALLANENIDEVKDDAFDLIEQFQTAKQEVIKQQKEKFVEEGGDPHYFEPPKDPLDSKFKEQENLFRDRFDKFRKERKQDQEKNLEVKKDLISELQDIIAHEENIGRAFSRFNAVKKKWNETGEVAPKVKGKIRHDYSQLIEEFYYRINIYKELKEHDLRKNLEKKRDLTGRIEKLEKEPSIKETQILLDAHLAEWDQLGPVIQEEWPATKEAFHEAVGKIKKKIADHYKELREKQKEHLEKKEAIIARLDELIGKERDHHKKWVKATNEVQKLQDEFRKTGPAPRSKNEKAWDTFKSKLDTFFENRRNFYAAKHEEFKEVRSDKKDIIAEAEKLLPAEDANLDRINWKELTGRFKGLQIEWRKAGILKQADERKMWKAFRKVCDSFFERKKAYFASLDERKNDNLKEKEKLIGELEKFESSGTAETDKNKLEALTKAFQAAGPVPGKEKDKVNKAFNKASREAMKKVKMDKDELREMLFRNKIDLIKSEDPAPMKALQHEQRSIKKKIKDLESEKLQYENNLGFFKYTADDNPLKKEVIEKIGRVQQNIDELKQKATTVSKTIKFENDKKKAAETENPEAPAEGKETVKQSAGEDNKDKA